MSKIKKIIFICLSIFICITLSFGLFFLFKVRKAEVDSINFWKNSPNGYINLVTVLDDRVRIQVELQNMRYKYPVRQFYKHEHRIDGDSLIFNVYYRYIKAEHGYETEGGGGDTGIKYKVFIEIMCDTKDIQKVIFEGKNEGDWEVVWDRSDETGGKQILP